MMTEQWKVGNDLFGAAHVYDKDGDRLTNEHMCGTEGWEDRIHLIAAAPETAAERDHLKEINADLLEALKWAERALAPFSKEPTEKSGINMIRAAIAKAEDKS